MGEDATAGTALSQIMGFDNHMITTESRAYLQRHDFAGTLPGSGGGCLGRW
jgi:hypothetical protein